MIDDYAVERVEYDDRTTITYTMKEPAARKLYENWVENMERFRDKKVSLIRIETIKHIEEEAINGIPS